MPDFRAMLDNIGFEYEEIADDPAYRLFLGK